MKKLILATAILATSATAFASNTATGGTVNFYGNVTNTSCTISVNGQGSDADIYLSPIARNEFKEADVLYKVQPFTIDVSDCIYDRAGDLVKDDEPTNIGVLFTGGNVLASDTTKLVNIDSQGAQGAYFSITNQSGKVIEIGNGAQVTSDPAHLPNNVLRFTYKVGYVAANPGEVTVGQIQSYVTYQIKYD